MKTKGQAKDEIACFVNMIYTQMDRTVKRVRIDNGREFGGQALIDWLRSHGIGYEATVPYGPEQNGVAERSNGLLAARARAMILDSSVPHNLWPEAVKTACYLLNRLPTSAIEHDKVPMQLLYESLNDDGTADPIDLGHVRSFGCTAYVHIPKEKRRQGAKFEARSNKGILVGYEGRNQYRIWLPEEGKQGRVVRARDVKFDEGPSIYDEDMDPKLPNASTPMEQANERQSRNSTEGTTSTEQGGVDNNTPHPFQAPPLLTPMRPFHTSPPYESPYQSTYIPSNEASMLNEYNNDSEENEEDVTEQPPKIDVPSPPTLRRSGRQRQVPSKFSLEAIVALPAVCDAFLDAAATTTEERTHGEPTTYKEAVSSPDSKQWKQAMDSELKSLEANSTWDLVKLPPDHRALRGRWVYRYK